jgi:N-acyl-D-amino-acid deacylase
MRKYLVLACMIMGIVAFKKGMEETDAAAIDAAINKSLPLLQSSSHTFLKNAPALVNCHSCHNQGLGLVTFAMAKQRGFAVNDTIYNEAIDSTYKQWKIASNIRDLMEDDDPLATLIVGDYDLWALKENNFKGDKMIDILSKNIMHMQMRDGNWFSPGQRPPLEYYSFSVTALAAKNIQAYMPAILNEEVAERVSRAREWMTQTKPLVNEEKVFQLLGLTWCNGDRQFIAQQAKKLLAEQHADGGWSQLDSLPTDAYASGQALYALNQSGQLEVADKAYQKGIAFLLRTQEEDGSWHVKTRTFPFLPYVNSGFPHQADQFISAAGSNWATMALLLAAKKAQ